MNAVGRVPYDAFSAIMSELQLKVGRVTDCVIHEGADNLLVLKVEVGPGEFRTICSAIRHSYKPQDIIGKKVVVATNVAPREMRGVMSDGRLITAKDSLIGSAHLLTVDAETISPGSGVR